MREPFPRDATESRQDSGKFGEGVSVTSASRAQIAVALGCALALAACASLPDRFRRVDPLRVSELAAAGDPARRASLRLVLDGLRAEAALQPTGAPLGRSRAKANFERAIQVDPTNPYAFLALARHHVDGATPSRALRFLERAESLLEAEGAISPRVEPHLIGLRGEVLYRTGERALGAHALDRAGRLAPDGPVKLALYSVNVTPVAEGFGKIGFQSDGLIVVLDGPVEMAFAIIGIAPVVEGKDKIGFQANGLIVVVDGPIPLAFLFVGQAPI